MKGLTKTRLKKFLQPRCDYPLETDDDCDLFFIVPSFDDNVDNNVSVKISFSLIKDSTYSSFLQIHGEPQDVSIPRKRMGEAVLLCNDWNLSGEPFGRAIFAKESKIVVIDEILPTDHQIDEDELVDFLNRSTSGIISFLNKAAEVFGW